MSCANVPHEKERESGEETHRERVALHCFYNSISQAVATLGVRLQSKRSGGAEQGSERRAGIKKRKQGPERSALDTSMKKLTTEQG